MAGDRRAEQPPSSDRGDGAGPDDDDGPVSGASPQPAEQLVAVLWRSVPPWLERCVVRTADRQLGRCPDELRVAARTMAATRGPEVVAEVERLLAADVDAQRGTPLTVLRAAIRHPTEVLAAVGVPPVPRDPFAAEHFPADVYDLSPSGWSDIDPELHEAGLVWGAWKAGTVLARRRGRPGDPTMS